MVWGWDGDGTQTVGVVRPSKAAGTNRLLLRNSRGPVLSFTYGRYGDRVLAGPLLVLLYSSAKLQAGIEARLTGLKAAAEQR